MGSENDLKDEEKLYRSAQEELDGVIADFDSNLSGVDRVFALGLARAGKLLSIAVHDAIAENGGRPVGPDDANCVIAQTFEDATMAIYNSIEATINREEVEAIAGVLSDISAAVQTALAEVAVDGEDG